MKKNILHTTLTVLAAALLFCSCEKNAIESYAVPVADGSFIKLVHAAQEAPMVNLYLGDAKVSAIAPNAQGVTLGLSYAGTAVFPIIYGYANVPAGNTTVQVIDTVKEGGAAELIASQSIGLEATNNYSAFLIGKTGAFETLVIKDNLPPSGYAKTYVRFVNVMNGAPSGFDVKANFLATETKPASSTAIGTNVAYKEHTPYIELDPGTYNFAIHVNGSASAYTTMTKITPVAGRVYTFYLRGNYTSSPAVANRVLIRDR